jgi:hypothetical protein
MVLTRAAIVVFSFFNNCLGSANSVFAERPLAHVLFRPIGATIPT